MTPQKITPHKRIHLPKRNSWAESWHEFDEESAYAIEMALATNRPLLIRGEPGIGKSQLARAAAESLGRLLISEVVNISTEGQDLLWRFDPVARLNDAQVTKDAEKLKQKYYINPSVLWWVFDWADANEQYENTCHHKSYKPDVQGEVSHDNGIVLLLDEIDKADPSLPNSLLEVLGNGGFQVPMLEKTVGLKEGQVKPLVIITTNEERELPPAFLRRCLVLNLYLDNEVKLNSWWNNKYKNDDEKHQSFQPETALNEWLSDRAEIHYPNTFDKKVKQQAASYLIEDRNAAKTQGMVKPGQAEYLDLLKALDVMTTAKAPDERKQQQLELLDKIKDYALVKAAQ